MARISELLYEADNGRLRMPEFQRGWVWKKKNVRELFESLYQEFPIGSIIIWPTRGEDGQLIESVIDGQQRLTAMYSVIRGVKPPWFRSVVDATLDDLMFNVETEEFDYATKARLEDLLWISVSRLFADTQYWIDRCYSRLEDATTSVKYLQRVIKLQNITKRNITVSKLPEDMEVEKAVRVFDIINRAGTKVSKGDLVLGQLSIRWKGARDLVEKKLAQWAENSYKASTEWLLHAMSAALDNRIEFDILLDPSTEDLGSTFDKVVKACEELFNILRDQLGLGHEQKMVLNMGIIPIVYDQITRDETRRDYSMSDRRMIGWWLLGTLRQRWSADTRNRVNIDIATIEAGEGVSELLKELNRKSSIRGIHAEDFAVKRTPAQNYYRLLLILTRRCGAQDLGSGVTLSFHQMGELSSLQTHHIFPVKLLRQNNIPDKQIHQLANLAFVLQGTNLRIGAKAPADYLPNLEMTHPGVLKSQWIPENPRLWKVEAYDRFLEERRKLLAEAANGFLRDLIGEDF